MGLTTPFNKGQTFASIQMVIPGREIIEPNAHAGPITALEFASIGG